MKFAESLEQTLVSEWREKYVKYKTGKRLIKAIQRAVDRTNGVVNARNFLLHPLDLNLKDGFHGRPRHETGERTPLRNNPIATGPEREIRENTTTNVTEQNRSDGSSIYPSDDEAQDLVPAARALPATREERRIIFQDEEESNNLPQETSLPIRDGSYPALTPLIIPSTPNLLPLPLNVRRDRGTDTPRPSGVHRFSTGHGFSRAATQMIEIKMHPIEMVHLRQQEFFTFLHDELEKVEAFFQQKEAEAGSKLDALREQLHIMRARHNAELSTDRQPSDRSQPSVGFKYKADHNKFRVHVRSKRVRDRPNSEAMQVQIFTPATSAAQLHGPAREYARRPSADDKVTYKHAKHKLRLAIQELYRSLELLRSYALLNRTAFRKLNRKYDKVAEPQLPLEWFHDKVDKAYFVNSKIPDEYVETLEDLYARYLEQGNCKLAAEKLRQLTQPKGDKSASALLNGIMVGIGVAFAIEGAVYGIKMLNDEDEYRRAQTPFLLQLYAGYFLMLYLFSWFCFNCRTWTKYKVNYAFIFEFDPRHDLDWRQLSNFPCFFTLIFGIFIRLNFAKNDHNGLFLWYPVMLIVFTLLVIFLPIPYLRWRARRWFLIAHWRLFFSGLYPIEFRDFFLGDMYCSLSYSIVNIELFFCLYGRQWNEPIRCSSRFSRLVGFVATVPLIWRSLQCVRRFWDTKHAFPHLANLLKYTMAIVAAVALSLFRLDNDPLELSLFIAFATISAIYSAAWDVFMDFSLLQDGPYLGLRETMAFDKPWLYYGILIIDPLLRFVFILQAIFTHNIQHGSYVAFVIAFVEATRRGMWALFRVENEHCTNIKAQKTSRDIPLPYSVPSKEARLAQDGGDSSFALLSMRGGSRVEEPATPNVEAGEKQHAKSKIAIFRSLSRRLGAAHTQDFQKRKDAPTIEEMEEPQGIEQALLDDEGSDNEIEQTSEDGIQDEADRGSQESSDQVTLRDGRESDDRN